MSVIIPGVCRYCGCTEARPCIVPPFGSDDTCCWISDSNCTVCSGAPCVVKWDDYRKAMRAAARPTKRSTADIHQLICGRGRKGKRS